MKTQLNFSSLRETTLPDEKGFFGEYGGRFVPPPLEPIMQEIEDAYEKIKDDPVFIDELLLQNIVQAALQLLRNLLLLPTQP